MPGVLGIGGVFKRPQQLDNFQEINMPIIVLTIKSVYGVPKVYPAPGNRTAELFAALTGTKTFSPRDLVAMDALGYKIEYVSAYEPA